MEALLFTYYQARQMNNSNLSFACIHYFITTRHNQRMGKSFWQEMAVDSIIAKMRKAQSVFAFRKWRTGMARKGVDASILQSVMLHVRAHAVLNAFVTWRDTIVLVQRSDYLVHRHQQESKRRALSSAFDVLSTMALHASLTSGAELADVDLNSPGRQRSNELVSSDSSASLVDRLVWFVAGTSPGDPVAHGIAL